jgi:hypothetical protein
MVNKVSIPGEPDDKCFYYVPIYPGIILIGIAMIL